MAGFLKRLLRREPEDDSIGGILLRVGFITRDQLRAALTIKMKASPEALLGEILVAQGAVTRTQLERALIQQDRKRGAMPDYAARARDLIAGVHAQNETLQAHLEATRDAVEAISPDAPRLVHLKGGTEH